VASFPPIPLGSGGVATTPWGLPADLIGAGGDGVDLCGQVGMATNMFCAAVAWRDYPPAEGTPATMLNAVANLDRVRVLKQATRDAKIVTRHQQALAAARRQEQLQAARAGLGCLVAALPIAGT
jgi:hypothetical protein